ncbi:hypothetical protein BBW65_07215 [Helicobacter enhydrae]|uniref:Peroxide stress protein YaaA n=1 Tax=Helicobacter enhydrae TaxID=222136 RepID=A0A1B1U779_9HELI|nr:peroxide stress protein YaaA [Helicobacter enhydrae]ANV98596.1 hypothetical protein BBW65_07215 [Helicobacter enhydrae]
MKILFSPSEGKRYIKSSKSEGMLERHQRIYDAYADFVGKATLEELSRITGFSKEKEILEFLEKMQKPSLQRAIELYDGVAYDALDYGSLTSEQRHFVSESVLIFSNLFGVVGADSLLPFYKLKQGTGFGGFGTKNLYQEQYEIYREMIEGEFVVDLRAEFYKKLYSVGEHCFEFEFLKDGKKVSHYAKYYRGLVLRVIAQNASLDGIEEALEEYGLQSVGSKESSKKTTLIFAIS